MVVLLFSFMITPNDVDTHVIMEQFVSNVQTQDYTILYDIDIVINFVRLPYHVGCGTIGWFIVPTRYRGIVALQMGAHRLF